MFVITLLRGMVSINMVSKSLIMNTIKEMKAFARTHFLNARGSHNWEHTERVYRLCMQIGQVEKADLEVLEMAAYLHDIGRPFEDEAKGKVCHAQKGAEMAVDFLKQHGVSNEKRANIIHCIQAHRYRGKDHPETLEAKVLFDADKLDAIGAVGIARTFLFAGEVGAKLHNPHTNLEDTRPYTEEDTGYREYKLKLCKVKDRMLTHEGRRMAAERHAFMESYFQRLTEEYEGNK
jgi:uncharacterized protein